jgi:hypothetical protein
MFSLLLSVVTKICSINLEPPSVPLWTEEELESFVTLWLVIFSAWIKTAMFLLYHSKGCNICELVLHECYINDLYTITYSSMLGHHRDLERYALLCDLYLHKNVLKNHQTHVRQIHTSANDDSLSRPCRAMIGWEWARCESTCLGFRCLGRWDSPWLTI